MEPEKYILLDEFGPDSSSMSGACTRDRKNTSTRKIASCKTGINERALASVEVRITPEAEISEGSTCTISKNISEDIGFREETNKPLINDQFKDKCLAPDLTSLTIHSDAPSLPPETGTWSKMEHVSPANSKEQILDDRSQENSKDLLSGAIIVPSTVQNNAAFSPTCHAKNTSSESEYKHEVHDKRVEVPKPMSKDNFTTTEVIVTSSDTTNAQTAAQSNETLTLPIDSTPATDEIKDCESSESQSLNAKVGHERISVTESIVLSYDNSKTTRSDSDLDETRTARSKTIRSPIETGIQSENQSTYKKAVVGPKMHCFPEAAHIGRTQNVHRSCDELLQRLYMPTFSDISKYGWKPKAVVSVPTKYNSKRRQEYAKTSLDSEKLHKLLTFYDKKLQTDEESETSTIDLVDNILEQILVYINMSTGNKFSSLADDEGSVTVDANVGKLDELDYSVEILLEDNDQILLSDEPFNIEYANDDIDAYVMDEITETEFVDGGKRLFPNESRPVDLETNPVDIPEGQVAVWLGPRDALRFGKSCTAKRIGEYIIWGWILPYQMLNNFHKEIDDALQNLGLEGVSLNNGARGPAVTLTILQQDGPNISVDITPKLNITAEQLNVTDFHWPRKDTKRWLKKSKIKKVCAQIIYLVPKGDKYWKISFANLENELLDDIDDKGTWRKQCLRIMKKKLIQWKSTSRAGLKCISSYLLKTTLLWLCEILPDDSFWTRDQLANRYLNFLQELEHRLEKKIMGEYFNPSVNLLEYKDDEDVKELRQFLLDEIEGFTK
ncbi:uncharacterized protein LOC123536414 [Mercenaria mercenaria]|uniref:uncharacterized protein LOC123536414 n=1 Tax=Mercenaria mercenaria TaxID=6596 RepID=UPI00234EE515|nr:uncharacterized protein LOC123536414 [Mercenaria mercenaria]